MFLQTSLKFWFKDFQSPWMLIVANELTILMIKKTYLEKKEYVKISKITSANDNTYFDMKQNLSQGKQLSISRYGGLMGFHIPAPCAVLALIDFAQ